MIFIRFLAGLFLIAGGGGCIYAGLHQHATAAAIALYIVAGILILVGFAFWGLYEVADDVIELVVSVITD